jgi:release factor glutamine methyltransferase
MKPLLEVLTSGTGYLVKKGIEEPRLNMEHLLAHVLQCRRMDLYLRFDKIIPEPQLEALRPLLKRRGEGEPLQHLLGSVEFCGHELICDHRALVPRPETETLVELTLAEVKAQPPARILDMATGSGCIGLSLAKALPAAALILADISEDALELTRLNATRLGLDSSIRTLRTDLYDKLEGQTFDLIIANLPYIPSAEIAALSREVKRDPVLALDGGTTGLEIIERFLTDSAAHLNEGGLVALEVGHNQGPATAELCRANQLATAWTKPDLAGVERFVFARR